MSTMRRSLLVASVACLLAVAPTSAFAESVVDTVAAERTQGISGERVAGVAGAFFLLLAVMHREGPEQN